MTTIKIKLWKNGPDESYLYVRLPDEPIEPRPAFLAIPGGGYSCVCEDREGLPIAEAFEQLGYRGFSLSYRCAPHRFPEPQLDALRAIKLIRANAQQWGVIPNMVATGGFSAGGHLAASTAMFARSLADQAVDGDVADGQDCMPNALMLAYPVLLAGSPYSHNGSFENLLGPNATAEDLAKVDFAKNINSTTPPAFIWHTRPDGVVNYKNSLICAERMWECGRPCQLTIFPTGGHGMCLGHDGGADRTDIALWPAMANEFFIKEAGFNRVVLGC